MRIEEEETLPPTTPQSAEDSDEDDVAALPPPAPGEVIGFEDLGLSEETLKTIHDAGYEVPTPIQEKAIPVILDGCDVVGSAQTGTGKTATFTIPIVELLAGRGGTLAVVLSPTREIAQQTFDCFEIFGKPRGVHAAVLIGGVDMKPQLEALKTYPQVIVATPGRLVDHMERGTVWLDYVEMVVLDEADRMLDMGFMPQISRILNEIPSENRQTLLFSATIPPPIEKLTKTMMYEPVRISVGKPLAAASTVEQELWICEPKKKMSELRRILRNEPGTIIVFTRSKKGAVELWQSLHSAGHYDVTMLHSDRTQEQRMQALADFKSGKHRVLIATDVAARGIDVANVAHVVNFDVPLVPEDYVHRIGRSGRAQAKGRSTTLYTYQDKRLLHDIEKMLGRPIPVTRNATEGSGSGGGGASHSERDERGGGRGGGGRRGGRGRGGGGGERRPEGRPQQQHQTSSQGAPAVQAQSHQPAAGSQGAMAAGGAPGTAGGEAGAPRKRRRRRGGRGRRGRGGAGNGGAGAPGGTPPAPSTTSES